MAMRLVPTSHVHDTVSVGPLAGNQRSRKVNILRAVWVDTGRDYRGKLGAKDIARRQKAGAA